MNKIFVAYKPRGLSSNAFLSKLKKKYKVKKAGYSGTLDPFAKGVLIIAFNQYTKLFRFLAKTPKIYHATLWLGLESLSLDDKNIKELKILQSFDLKTLEKIRKELLGELEFIPPDFSAKKIQGQRAYELAKKGIKPDLKPSKMEIFSSKILHYHHPFLTMQLTVSEGAYVRSYCEIFAKKLGIKASLSYLERVREGDFCFDNEKSLNVLEYLKLKENFLKDPSKLQNGTKLIKEDLKFQDEGDYFIKNENFFSIIQVEKDKVSYLLNHINRF